MAVIDVKTFTISPNAIVYHYTRGVCYTANTPELFKPYADRGRLPSVIKKKMPDAEIILGKEYIQVEYNLYVLKSDCTEVIEKVEAIPPKQITEKSKLIEKSVFTTSSDQKVAFWAVTGFYSITLTDGVLPADTYTIKVIDRSSMTLEGYNYYSDDKPVTPTRLILENSNGIQFKITMPSLKQYDVVSYPTTYAYAIMAADGSFYAGPEYVYSTVHGQQTTPIFGTYGKAKKYKDLSKLKASVMCFIGYTSFTESMEIDSMDSARKNYDFDPTWRAVKIDKLTNTIVDTIDIMPWLNGLLRLKPITVKFGSSVRAARKDFENGKYEFPFVAVKKFDLDDVGDPIKVKGTSLVNKKVTPCKIYSASDSVAVACSKASATKIKFANDGISIIDLDSLSELIEE